MGVAPSNLTFTVSQEYFYVEHWQHFSGPVERELLPLNLIRAWPPSGWARLIPTHLMVSGTAHLMVGLFLEQDKPLNHYTRGS